MCVCVGWVFEIYILRVLAVTNITYICDIYIYIYHIYI